MVAVSADAEGEKWIKHYSSCHRILLVSEGDFSFALCVAKAFGSANNIIATSSDSEDLLVSKHSTAKKHLMELERLGCTILYEVDVFTMSDHPVLMLQFFDRIVFNFPHSGFCFGEHHPRQIELHQKLVKGFLGSAQDMLTLEGEIHVTHKTSYPFSRWRITDLALEVGLYLYEEVCFSRSDYSGYINKRGSGRNSNKTFRVGECSTFKFKPSELSFL